MRRRSLITLGALVTILVISSSTNAATAQPLDFQFVNWDRGVSERTWTAKTKPPTDQIIFSWVPTLDPSTSVYILSAKCDQFDDDNEPAGRNRVFFENVSLTGVDSDNTVEAARQSKRTNKGRGKFALWDLTPHVASFEADSAVLVAGEVRATRELEAFQALNCEISVWELFDIEELRGESEADRLSYFREVFRAGLPSRHLCIGRRWLDLGDGTVLDCNTRKMWLRQADCLGTATWAGAQAKVDDLNDTSVGKSFDCKDYTEGTYKDWRVPTITEWCSAPLPQGREARCAVANRTTSLLDGRFRNPGVSNSRGDGKWESGNPFVGLHYAHFWSTTQREWRGFTTAWHASTVDGSVSYGYPLDEPGVSVWPVRGGQ